MKTKLIWITPNIEKTMIDITRGKIKKEYKKLLKHCLENKHWSVFEMANMCIEIETSRFVSHQIIRHKSFSFQEFSQRYHEIGEDDYEELYPLKQSEENRQSGIDELDDFDKEDCINTQERLWNSAYFVYKKMLDLGISRDTARQLLPESSLTKITMNGTIRSWIHYLELRTDQKTQYEHRLVAESIKEIFKIELPIISKILGW